MKAAERLEAQALANAAVTNQEFADVIFSEQRRDSGVGGEVCWAASFACSPDKAGGLWAGSMYYPTNLNLNPEHNTYFSVALLKNGERIARTKDNFSRLCVVVLDDASACEMGFTYRIQTSVNKYQIGFKLTEPIEDIGVATRLHAELSNKGALNANDKSGNNPVRYVRLPVGTNTKYEPHFAHILVDWHPDVTVSLDDLISGLGLNRAYIMSEGVAVQKLAPKALPAPVSAFGGALNFDERSPDADLIAKIVSGEDYHDATLILTARYIKAGMSEQAVVELVRGIMQASNDGSDRWKNRYADIERMTRTAFMKFAQPVQAPRSGFVVSASKFAEGAESPYFLVEGILQQGLVYSCTAKAGHGKTAILLTLAVHIALGKPFADKLTVKSKVLFMAGENPADVRLRLLGVCQHYGFDIAEVDENLMFTTYSFAIDNATEREAHVEQIKAFGHFDVAFIDTLPTHSALDDDNSNSQMLSLAKDVRDFGRTLGNPAVVAMMHPPQAATKATLRSRGGGAFAGEIDGELLMWQELGIVAFWHSTKFRGAGFKTLFFALLKVELAGFDDNFGNMATTVVAEQTAPIVAEIDLSPAGSGVMETLEECLKSLPISAELCVSKEALKQAFMSVAQKDQPNTKPASIKKAFARGLADALKKGALYEVDGNYRRVSDGLFDVIEGDEPVAACV